MTINKSKYSVANIFRSTLTLISPKLNISVVYLVKKKRILNWKHPSSFVEKLLVLRANSYNYDPIVKQCADKYRVREYVSMCGLNSMLNELIASYDCVDDIEYDKLPEKFAIKLNYSAGYNIICTNKEKLNKENVKNKINSWLKDKPWLWYAELQYKNVKPKILIEKYIEGKDGRFPDDYKFYCFHGEPIAILYMRGRNSDNFQVGFFDAEWNYLGESNGPYKGFDKIDIPPRPRSLDQMVKAATILSNRFPFVRVDMYDLEGKALFGELTFSPSGGFDLSEIAINGKDMGEYLKI